MSSLEEVFSRLRDALLEKDRVYEQIRECVREIIRLSKIVISLVHRGLMDEAKAEAEGFKQLMERLERLRRLHDELRYLSLIASAYQEYCEAKALLVYLEENRIPGWEELSSPPMPYLLGLLDMVGELRRLVLENIRQGHVEKAEQILRGMDMIYEEALKVNSRYALSAGLRSKLDLARRLTEATRGELILELRRKSLEDAIRKLEKSIRKTAARL